MYDEIFRLHLLSCPEISIPTAFLPLTMIRLTATLVNTVSLGGTSARYAVDAVTRRPLWAVEATMLTPIGSPELPS